MTKILKDYSKLNANDKKILNEMIDNPSRFISLSIKNICQIFYVSRSTFLRLLKKTKIDTIKNLRLVLAEEMDKIFHNSNFSEIINQNVLKNTSYIDGKKILDLVKKINNYKYVWLFGVSANYYLLKILEMYFRKCGIYAIAVNSVEKINLDGNNKDTCVILFSRSMQSQETTILINKVKNKENLDVYSITENEKYFQNINSIILDSYSPIKKVEKETPFFYHLNIFMMFTSAFIKYIEEKKIASKIISNHY